MTSYRDNVEVRSYSRRCNRQCSSHIILLARWIQNPGMLPLNLTGEY